MLKDFDINSIRDMKDARECIQMLLNLVESLYQGNLSLKKQLQNLQNEINRLKGEQGKPPIKPGKNNSQSQNYSSEKERKETKQWKKNSKVDRIKIHDNKKCYVDKNLLPVDAQFKGYEKVIVQDIKFEAFNTLFLKEKYYSPSQNKTWLAPLPPGYEGEFGPTLKSFVIKLYFDSNITQPKILDLLHDAETIISAGQISKFLINNHHQFHKEKDQTYEAGLRSSPWHHIDDTSTRVNGNNYYCHIMCNPLYTSYFTTPNKTRLTVIDVLRNFKERIFLLNDEAFCYIRQFKLPAPVIQTLQLFPQNQQLCQKVFLPLLDNHLPHLGPQQRSHVLDAAAIAAYHAQMEIPIVELLICDDAPQFKIITRQLALCWVHDGRYYKKISPYLICHQQLLDAFLDDYWNFYSLLLEYKQQPSAQKKQHISNLFDELFATKTGFNALDDRITKTKEKKHSLLLVLDHPEIPLHNNQAELDARKRVRKRVISYGTRCDDGTKAWDTFLSLAETAKKLGINFFNYIYDRISGNFEMPSLAQIITKRASELNLGASWNLPP